MNPLFDIICQHAEFIAVNKRIPCSFHSEQGEAGFFEQVKQLLNLTELYPVHRLDKGTTGIVLFAKTLAGAQHLGRAFEQKQIQKYYLALSDRKPKKKQGHIKGGMAPARRGAWKLTLDDDNFAVTQFFSTSIAPHLRLFIVKPLTGKTHQIRVALKSIGAPILGDSLYAGSTSDRLYLHAFQIVFHLNGEDFNITAPPTSGQLFLSDEFINHQANSLHPHRLNWPS